MGAAVTSAKAKRGDWIVMNANHGGRFECLRCGRHHMPTYPIETWALTALGDGFSREHRGCQLKAEGLHCTFCGKTGHEPDKCDRPKAKMPEEWLAGPDTGLSSRTIYGVLHHPSGYSQERGRIWDSTPLDPSDFGRCYRLLALFPEWRARLSEVAAKHPSWRALVGAWDELTSLYEQELPTGKCPRLYARMRELERSRA